MASSSESSGTGSKMEWFAFSEAFNGPDFYMKHKNAEFLKEENNLRTILVRSDDLGKRYEALEPGASLAIRGMFLKPDVPLILKKSALVDESDIDQDRFTLRRLLGFVAAYVYSKYSIQWEVFHSIESERMGLSPPHMPNNLNGNKAYYHNQPGTKLQYNAYRAYYSAVPGAEYFQEQFDYYPFLFALRRFQLNLISQEQLLAVAKTRNYKTMISLVMQCANDFSNASNITSQIGFSLHEITVKLPQDIKCFFKRNQCGGGYF